MEIARSFVYDVATRIDTGEEHSLARESAMAKMRCTEIAKNSTLEAMQMMGGYGYAREYGMEGQVRRALAPPIYGGTNEIQREIIAKSLFSHRRLTGDQVVLNQLTFGDKIESPEATKLPVLLAVALLKDRAALLNDVLPVRI